MVIMVDGVVTGVVVIEGVVVVAWRVSVKKNENNNIKTISRKIQT